MWYYICMYVHKSPYMHTFRQHEWLYICILLCILCVYACMQICMYTCTSIFPLCMCWRTVNAKIYMHNHIITKKKHRLLEYGYRAWILEKKHPHHAVGKRQCDPGKEANQGQALLPCLHHAWKDRSGFSSYVQGDVLKPDCTTQLSAALPCQCGWWRTWRPVAACMPSKVPISVPQKREPTTVRDAWLVFVRSSCLFEAAQVLSSLAHEKSPLTTFDHIDSDSVVCQTIRSKPGLWTVEDGSRGGLGQQEWI